MKRRWHVGCARLCLMMIGWAAPVWAAEQPTAFCRLVPERMDDFAWENDRIAFRMYGPALWEIPAERCGSGVDVWVKKVREPIIDKWMKCHVEGKSYHEDTGEGADFYKVGKTLGCGGLGYWVYGKLVLNRHFASQRVIQGSGKLIEFELVYAPLEVGGKTVTETKRIRMETGRNLFEVHNRFAIQGGGELTAAVGIVREKGKDLIEHGENWIAYAGPDHPKNGQTYCAVVMPGPATFHQTKDHVMFHTSVKGGETLVYRAGAGWSKGLDFPNFGAWVETMKSGGGAKP